MFFSKVHQVCHNIANGIDVYIFPWFFMISVLITSCSNVQNSIVFFQSTHESVIRRATMMGEMHLRNLRQKSLLRQRTEDALKKLQVSWCYSYPQKFGAKDPHHHCIFWFSAFKISIIMLAMLTLVILNEYWTPINGYFGKL